MNNLNIPPPQKKKQFQPKTPFPLDLKMVNNFTALRNTLHFYPLRASLVISIQFQSVQIPEILQFSTDILYVT